MQNISYPTNFFRPFSFKEEMNHTNLFELEFDTSILELPKLFQKSIPKEDLFKPREILVKNKKKTTILERKEQTKSAARKYRQRKKEKMDYLELAIKNLTIENEQLSKDLFETNRKIKLLELSNCLLKNGVIIQ